MVPDELMNILLITHSYPNYVPDLLLHGLRKLVGPTVVDYPRKDCLYEGVLGLGVCPDGQRCPNWFPDDKGRIDRGDIWSKVKGDYFDLVVCDVRALQTLTRHLDQWPRHTVIIDGEDQPQAVAPGPYVICRRETDGTDFSIPLPMALPKEIFNWIIRYDNLPKQHSIGFLGSTHDDGRKHLVEVLSHHYPDALFQATRVPSNHQSLPEGRLGRDAYYRKLQQCQMVLSLAGAGNDTFRFWENAACNAVHVAARFTLFIPDDFKDNREIIRFAKIDGLRRRIDGLLNRKEEADELICYGRHKLVNTHLTTHRAKYFLDRVQGAFAK